MTQERQRPAAHSFRLTVNWVWRMIAPAKNRGVFSNEDNNHFSESPQFNARQQRQHLQEAVQDWGDPPNDDDIVQVTEIPPGVNERAERSRRGLAALLRKRSLVIKSLLALAAAFTLGWTPVQHFMATTSTEAIINASLITLRSPISGQLSVDVENLDTGAKVHADQTVFTISDSRVGRDELDNLQREVAQLQTTAMVLRAKRGVLQRQRAEIVSFGERYKQGKIQALQKQVTAIDAQIGAAYARQTEFKSALARAERLYERGVNSQETLDKAQRDQTVGAQDISQLKEQRAEIEVAQDFAKKNVFISDGYNDTPVSAQRLLDLEVELAGIDADLKGTSQQLASAREDLLAEQARHGKLAVAKVKIAVAGRVWNIMVTPHEHVDAGQALMQILNCGSAHVTASVRESVYQKLLIGQRATFKPEDNSPVLKGWVSGLDGLAVVRTNEAIQPNLLSRAPYHVTVEFPELRQRTDCRVGRSGVVDFDTSDRTIRAIASINGSQ